MSDQNFSFVCRNHQQNKRKQVWFENRFTRTSQQTSQRETKNVNTKVWFNWKKCALSELPTSGTWYPPPQLVVRQKRAFIIYGIYRPVDIISICHVEYLDISAYQLNKSICIKSKSTCQQALWFNFLCQSFWTKNVAVLLFEQFVLAGNVMFFTLFFVLWCLKN
jgi:hypothetical protein